MRSASVSQALRSLSPAHREILNETYFRNRSVNEAAQLLGLPVDTVKARVYDALHALRVSMGRPAAQAAGDTRGRHAASMPVPGQAPMPMPGAARRTTPGSGSTAWATARPRPYADRWI